MTPTKTLTAFLLSGVLAATLGQAAMAKGMNGGGPMQMLDFDAIDADKDGKITAAEFAAFRAAEFASADTNKDGQINAAELTAKHMTEAAARAAEMSARLIDRMDANADAQISAEELESGPRPARMFERADGDGDGALTKAEVDAAMTGMRGKHGRHGRGNN